MRSHLHRALARLRSDLDRRNGGDRRAWALALLPFARTAGGILVGKKLAVAATLVLVLFGGIAVVATLGRRPAPVAPGPTSLAADPAPAAEGVAGDGATGAPAAGAGRVRGLVVRADGSPDPGARVLSYPDRTTEAVTDASPAVTGEDGRFELAAPGGPRRCSLFVSAPGCSPALETGVLPGADIRVVLPDARSLSGRVTDPAGEPVAGVVVSLSGLVGAVPVRRDAVANRGGAYRVEGIPAAWGADSSPPYVSVTAGGLAPLYFLAEREWGFTAVSLRRGGDSVQDFVLVPAGRVTGRVLDAETERPLPGARVVLSTSAAAASGPSRGCRTRSSPTFSARGGPEPTAGSSSRTRRPGAFWGWPRPGSASGGGFRAEHARPRSPGAGGGA